MGKRLVIILLLFFTVATNAQENTCRYISKTTTVNGQITSTVEEKVCDEIILIDQKSWWELFLSSPQFETTLIILLATLFNH